MSEHVDIEVADSDRIAIEVANIANREREFYRSYVRMTGTMICFVMVAGLIIWIIN